jgi:hypothetical protein
MDLTSISVILQVLRDYLYISPICITVLGEETGVDSIRGTAGKVQQERLPVPTRLRRTRHEGLLHQGLQDAGLPELPPLRQEDGGP